MKFNSNLIKKRRKELQLTQADLSRMVNCSQPIISQMEKNNYKHDIDESIIKSICDVLQLKIDDVIEQYNDPDIMDVDIFETIVEASTSIDSLDRYKPFLDSADSYIRFYILNSIKKWKLSYHEEAIHDLEIANKLSINNDNKITLDRMFLLTLLSLEYCEVNEYQFGFDAMMELIRLYYEFNFKDKNFKYCTLLWDELLDICIQKSNTCLYKHLFRIRYVTIYYASYKNYNGMPSYEKLMEMIEDDNIFASQDNYERKMVDEYIKKRHWK